MVWIAVVIIFFLSVTTLLLWTPLRLTIDTKQSLYKIEWQYIFSATLTEKDNQFGVFVRAPFFGKFIPIESLFKAMENTQPKRVNTKTISSISMRRMWSIFKKFPFSFDVKKCQVNWDTDDYITNAYLYPLTPFLQGNGKSFCINFEGKRDIELIVENRMGRILKLLLL